MHQELIRELAMITDEERRILEGKQEIDPQLYTEKKEMVVDSAKLLKNAGLTAAGGILPENAGKALRAEYRIDGIFQHQNMVGNAKAQCAAA